MKHIAADDNDLMDLVNKNDEVVGTIYQADASQLLESGAGFIRGTTALIQNDREQLWIPRRAATKRNAPNGLDFSVAEHVQAGETYVDGLIRGFKEELFIEVSEAELHFLGRLDPIAHIPYFFTSVFLYRSNDVPDYNHADFSGYEWLEPHAIITRIDNGEPCKDALKTAIQKFFL